MIATHLSVSSRTPVAAVDVQRALATGDLRSVVDPTSQALISGMFAEIDVNLIMCATDEARGTIATSDALYRQTIAGGAARSALWEAYARELL
jgi:hypothetical protein